jgi:hypothetical protein
MSTRYNDGSHYENHQRAAELHDEAAHAHRTAEEHRGKQEHQTGHEQSRQALEHSRQAYLETQGLPPDAANQHGIATFGHEDIAALAHALWHERGCPEGSPEQDWFRAAELLRSGKYEWRERKS